MSESFCVLSDFSYPIVGGTERHVYELSEYLSKRHKVLVISPVWGNERKCYEFNDNFRIRKFKLPLRKTKLRVLYYFLWLLRYARRVDRINSYSLLPSMAGLVYAKLMRKKWYVTILDYENIVRSSLLRYLVPLLNQACKVIAISQYLKDKLVEQGVKPEKVTVISCWVNLKEKECEV